MKKKIKPNMKPTKKDLSQFGFGVEKLIGRMLDANRDISLHEVRTGLDTIWIVRCNFTREFDNSVDAKKYYEQITQGA